LRNEKLPYLRRSLLEKSSWILIGLLLASQALPATHSYNLSAYQHISPPAIWLPIHENKRQVVAVGGYQLPEPILLPPGLTPIPLAYTCMDVSPSSRGKEVDIYFSASQEQAVYKWASSYPKIISSPTFIWGYRHLPPHRGYYYPGIIRWSFYGVAVTKHYIYTVIWQGGQMPTDPVTIKLLPQLQGNSPLKNEPRGVDLGILIFAKRTH